MNKSIKHIIVAAIMINIFAAINPTNYLNLTTTKAYAASDIYLKSISLNEGNNINFSKTTYSYIVDVGNNIDDIVVRAKPEYSSDDVIINGIKVTRDDNYRTIIDLKEGKNKIEIKVEDIYGAEATYIVYVYKGGADAVYLKDLKIDDSNMGFEKTNSFYNIELDEGTDIVKLETETEDDKYSVYVNNRKLGQSKSIKLKFGGIGKYNVSVKIVDEETKRYRTYTLGFYIGIPVSPNASTDIYEILKPNQWVIVNGRWRYNDSAGEPLKDTWFYDKKYGSYFYLNSNGNMQTGWVQDNGNWYYMNNSGEMQTGWIIDDYNWYYLDENGAMREGWIETNNKWYFLGKDGAMKTDWVVSDDKWYFLAKDGAMKTGPILENGKRYFLDEHGVMRTGWLKLNGYWYFLNNDGAMVNGEWIQDKGNWYYINYDGTMRTGWLYKGDKYYYLNENGAMNTGVKTIDGYTYHFNNDGSVNFDIY